MIVRILLVPNGDLFKSSAKKCSVKKLFVNLCQFLEKQLWKSLLFQASSLQFAKIELLRRFANFLSDFFFNFFLSRRDKQMYYFVITINFQEVFNLNLLDTTIKDGATRDKSQRLSAV